MAGEAMRTAGVAHEPRASVDTGRHGRGFPPRVVAALSTCRQELLAWARGDVLDLNLVGALREVEEAIAPASSTMATTSEGAARYDTVIGVAALAEVVDLGRLMSGIARLLRPDGRLWLVEPGYSPGLCAAAVTTLWSYHPALRGRHVGRNLAATVRSVGFTITDLERLTMPTTVRPLRSFLSIRAERFDR